MNWRLTQLISFLPALHGGQSHVPSLSLSITPWHSSISELFLLCYLVLPGMCSLVREYLTANRDDGMGYGLRI